MTQRFFSAVLLAALLSLPVARAAGATPPAAAVPQRELAVVVVDSLHRETEAFNSFNRIAYEFERVFRSRNWPVTATFERFAANTKSHELELKIFYQGIQEMLGGEKQWKGWMVLTDRGTKHDFGIVTYTYIPRPGELMDDTLAHLFHGAGEAAADRIEPYVAPRPATAKR